MGLCCHVHLDKNPSTLQRGIALSCNKLREIRSWGADVVIREFNELVKFVS